jgi:diguanylate cyclase (GGDEF)-like protein/PAS domain S-box-containing protein
VIDTGVTEGTVRADSVDSLVAALVVLAGLLTVVTAARASRQAQQPLRRSWRCYAAGILAVEASLLVPGGPAGLLTDPLGPGSIWPAVTIRLAGLALFAMSLHWAPGVRRTPLQWLSLSLDGVLVGGAVFVLAWTLAVDPRALPGAGAITHPADWSGQVVLVAGDVLLAAVLVGLAARTRGTDRSAPILLACAAVALTGADMAVLVRLLAGPVWLEGVGRVAWLLAAWVAAVAPAVGRVDPYRDATPAVLGEDLRRWPHLVVVVSTAVVVLVVASGRGLDPVVAGGTFSLLVGVIAQTSLLGTVNARLLAGIQRQADRMSSLLRHSSDIIMVADVTGQFRYVSPAVRTLLGHEPDVLVGRDWTDLVHPDDAAVVRAVTGQVVRAGGDQALIECRLRDAQGGWRIVESTASALPDGDRVRAIVINARDVTDRVALERELAHRANHDDLTGLPNRSCFTRTLRTALAEAGERRPVAVVYLDLDGFKAVNDSAGHAVGDALLAQAGRRLGEALRAGDVIARFGGDEFAAMLPAADPEVAVGVAERLRRTVAAPYAIDGREIVIDASVGIALSTPGVTAEDLLRYADIAMYRAKDAGRSRVELFAPELQEALVRRVTVETELRHALDLGELEVHYQPVVDLDTGAVPRVEALVRWRTPDGCLRMPGDFIPVAEASGLVVPLGRHVLVTAVEQAARWQADGLRVGVTVNLSARQLDQPDVVLGVLDVLDRYDVDPGLLTLEVTESALLGSLDVSRHRLAALRERGIAVALDDFGTGYSGLSYLRGLTVDVLKLDRDFVAGLGVEHERTVLVRTLISLARDLGLITIAEGVETPQQAALLRGMGCPWAQGYLFARPAPADTVTAWLQEGFSLARLA